MVVLMAALRLGPALLFAPPFTLMRVPVLVRVALAITLAIWVVDANPSVATHGPAPSQFLPVMLGELLIGIAIALGLQLTFAAIFWAGRAIDIQAGFGLAMLADPTTNAQIPLAGTVLAYATAIVFLTTGGHYDLIALWASSFELLPVGFGAVELNISAVGEFMSALFLLAMGIVGVCVLVIFLADMVIAFLSRTLPQMNVLLLGFQAKAILMLVTLPLAIALSAGLFLRAVRLGVTGQLEFWSAVP